MPTTAYSYSRLDSFKQCPRQYAYKYIEKPDVEKLSTIEAYLGTICHETVQQIYKDLRVSKRMTLEETLQFYEDRWERLKPPNLRIVRERYTEENYKETGKKYVRDFYELNQPFEDGKTIGIEKQVHISLGEGIDLQGYVDRLVDKGSGHYEIIDYKTQADLPSLQDLEKNWQLPLYHMALLAMFPDLKDVTCTWYYLAHNKSISLKRTKTDLDTLKTEILDLIKKIESTQEFDPRPSALCSWCDYEIVCPSRKHLVQFDNLPPAEAAKESGVQLVDSFMRLTQHIAESEAQLEIVQKKIFDYALKNNMRVVRGSQDKLTVWMKKGATQLPSKEQDPKAQLAVAQILKKHGLWEKYSYLSGFQLVKAIEAGEVLPLVVNELKPYLVRQDVIRLYPSKIREWI